jgi:hypothetical protein
MLFQTAALPIQLCLRRSVRSIVHCIHPSTLYHTSPHKLYPFHCPAKLTHQVTSVRHHGSITRPEPGTGYTTFLGIYWCRQQFLYLFEHRIKIHFKDSKGNLLKSVEANEGDDILSIAHEHDIDLEGTLHRSWSLFAPF